MLGFDKASWFGGAIVESLNQAFSRVIAIILLPVCFYLLSDLFWNLYYPDAVAVGRDNPGAQRAAAARGNQNAAWDWFVVHKQAEPKPAKPAKIDATLAGVLGVGDSGYAMISLGKAKPKMFHIGDEIKDGVVLKRVGQDHVILLRGESEEILGISKVNLFSTRAKADDTPAAGASSGAGKTKSAGISKNDLRDIIRKQPLKITEVVQFQAFDVPGHGRGYKVLPRGEENAGFFDEIGLVPGDIVVGVNGKEVGTLVRDPGAWKPLFQADRIELKVFRDGSVQDLTIDFSG